MNIGGVTNAFVLLIAARVNCLQSTGAAAAASVIIYPACGLSLPPLQQNKGIAENAGRTQRVREVRLVFIGDCYNICRQRARVTISARCARSSLVLNVEWKTA